MRDGRRHPGGLGAGGVAPGPDHHRDDDCPDDHDQHEDDQRLGHPHVDHLAGDLDRAGPLAEGHDLRETLGSDRAHEPVRMSIQSWALRRGV